MRRRITIVRDFPKKASAAVAFARHVAKMMTGNAYFPCPPIALPVLLAAAQELDEAEVATWRGTHGMASARDAERFVVHGLLNQLATYVVSVARQHGVDAEAVLASSGFTQKRTAGQKKWLFSAKQGARMDEAKLRTARAGRGASYDWQYSNDGVHWVDCPRTNEAKTTVSGLAPGTRYLFRVRSLFNNVLSDWSDPITLLVG